jgi:predicted Zn-dependent protease
MSDRLTMLRRLIEERPQDPFPRYGLAMEQRRLGRHEEAWACFAELLERHPGYVPAYLMAGQVLVSLGRADEAAAVYERGATAARAAGDEHARSELEAARAGLP